MTLQQAITELIQEDDELYTQTLGLYVVCGPLFGEMSFSIWESNNYLVACKRDNKIVAGCLWISKGVSADCLTGLINTFMHNDMDWLKTQIVENPTLDNDDWHVFDFADFHRHIQQNSIGAEESE